MKKDMETPCTRLPLTLVLASALVSVAVTANAGLLKTFDLLPSFFHCFEVVPTEET